MGDYSPSSPWASLMFHTRQGVKYVLYTAAGENGLPGASVRRYLEKLEADLWVLEFGVQRI